MRKKWLIIPALPMLAVALLWTAAHFRILKLDAFAGSHSVIIAARNGSMQCFGFLTLPVSLDGVLTPQLQITTRNYDELSNEPMCIFRVEPIEESALNPFEPEDRDPFAPRNPPVTNTLSGNRPGIDLNSGKHYKHVALTLPIWSLFLTTLLPFVWVCFTAMKQIEAPPLKEERPD